MEGMFADSVGSVDLSTWDIGQVVNMKVACKIMGCSVGVVLITVIVGASGCTGRPTFMALRSLLGPG